MSIKRTKYLNSVLIMELNKFDRVVAILLLLQTKKVIRAQDLATRFEVSLRTIYRDLRSLEHAGIPIHAEAGVGYSLVEGYSLPPVMFTHEEALSFLVAEKIVEKMSSKDTSAAFLTAVDKVKAVLKANDKEVLDNLSDHIHVAARLSGNVSFGEQYLQEILTAIDQQKCLQIDYHALYSKAGKTKRCIEPVGIQFYSNHWHLIGYCTLRNAYRDFRIDRIEKLTLTNQLYSQKHPNLEEYMDEVAKQRNLEAVTVCFSKKSADYARTQKYFYGFTHEVAEEERINMHFLTTSLMGMAHWLLVFVDEIEIIQPIELKKIMGELSLRLVAKHGTT